MKKILFLFLFIPVISYSQYTKKQLKKLKKMELEIVNRGLDLDATFVPYYKARYTSEGQLVGKSVEPRWAEAMFKLGLNVGDYSSQSQAKDANNREMSLSNSLIFNGRYVFDCNTYNVIKIQDLQNNNKIVATIKYKKYLNQSNPKHSYKKDYVIRELIKSNK